MFYIYTEDMKRCVPFYSEAELRIAHVVGTKDTKDTIDGWYIRLYYNTWFIVLAKYETEDDCIRVMEHIRREQNLNCRTCVMPSQEKARSLQMPSKYK